LSRFVNRYRITAAGAVLAGAAALIVPSTPALAGARLSLPGCKGSQLSAAMSVIPGSAGAGNIGYRLTLKNHGGACILGDHPGLKLLKANGQGLPTRVIKSGRTAFGTMTVGTGHSTSARLRFSPDVAGPGEPGKGPCEPAAHKVKVLLSAPGSGTVTGAVKPPTSVCEHGSIQEQPLG